MPDKVTYYAVVNDLSSREQPAGVFRRIYIEAGGRRDEAFTKISSGNAARPSGLRRARRPANEFIEITEDEADQIVEDPGRGDRRERYLEREVRKQLAW